MSVSPLSTQWAKRLDELGASMLKYVLALAVVLVSWIIWAVALEPALWWAPLIVSIIVGLVLASLAVARRLRAARAARELEEALSAQGVREARSSRPDLRAEMMAMNQEFQRAVAALKGSRLGPNALYDLPWYVIIGPPGAGKTTALRNSGIPFPYVSGGGRGIRGTAGTRNCDWWLSNHGVLLDTAGRWTTEQDDVQEWRGFLDLIKRYRPEKPLNGLVVAIGLDQLGGASDDEAMALGRRVRDRIDEVQSHLEMELPVYVLFTKADLVVGFTELFSDLSREERGQVWGFTRSVREPILDVGASFSDRFDEMLRAAERRSVHRMAEVRSFAARDLIFSFPQQFEVIRRPCQFFLAQAFEVAPGSMQSPVLRGVYYTSGTQEGRPIDRVMFRMAEAFGLPASTQLAEPIVEPTSYFLHDVFMRVVFADRAMASRSEAEQRRRRRGQLGASAAVFLLALMLAALPLTAWANNRTLIRETRQVVEGVSAVDGAQGPLTPGQIEPLRARVARLRQYNSRGAPVMYRFGMYQNQVYPPLSRFFATILRQRVVAPIVYADSREMDQFGRRYEAMPGAVPSGAEHSDMYDRLKMHLLLTYPRENAEPRLNASPEVSEWLAAHLARRWAGALGENPEELDAVTEEQIRADSQLFVELLADEDERNEAEVDGPALRFAREDDTVTRVRRALTRVSLTEMALERLIQEIEPLGYELRLRDLVGTTVEPMRSDGVVRGAFTRRAWEERVRDMLRSPESGVFGEPWVLGQEYERSQRTRAEQAEDLRRLRTQYFRGYIEEWRNFLRTIQVVMGGSNVRNLTGLQALTRGEPEPYRLLFTQVLYNTLLPEPDEATGDGGVDEFWAVFWRRVRSLRGGSTVAEIIGQGRRTAPVQLGVQDLTPEHVFLAFEGFTRVGAVPPTSPPPEGQSPPPPPEPPISGYEEQLDHVRDALQAHLDNPRDTDEPLSTALQTARTSTRALIENQEVGWRPRLEALLWPPIDAAVSSASYSQATGAGRSWCSEVYTPYHRNILGAYPINPRGHDVPLADFVQFYRPVEGTLWSFYDAQLARRIPREGDHFAFARNLGHGASNVYRAQLIQYLGRAYDITSVFFPPGSEGAQVEFDVRIKPTPRLAEIEFCSSGVCVEHHNGPERWHRFVWPGDDPVEGASIDVRGADGIHERFEQRGEWGVFRLLEQGTVAETSRERRVFTHTWRLRDQDVDISIEFRPVRGDAPFFGVFGRERNPPLLQPLRTSHVNPPREIVHGRATCSFR